jgi:hypothetical protein
MKYLKKFEDYRDLDDYDDDPNYGTLAEEPVEEKVRNKYWLIPTDKRCRKSLIEIGCKDESFFNYDYSDMDKYIYVTDYLGWGYMGYNLVSDKFFKDMNIEYMGTVNITDEELDKLEMMKSQNKYNL